MNVCVQVATDEATTRASEAFDYEFDGKSEFQQPALPPYPAHFAVGVIVGPSGSGPLNPKAAPVP